MKTTRWTKIAETLEEIDFINNLAVVEVDGKKLSLGWQDEKLFAFAYKCPHAGGVLTDGYIDALGNVVCPLHRYKFCMSNGRNVSGEGYYLKTYPVELREDGIYVGFSISSLLG